MLWAVSLGLLAPVATRPVLWLLGRLAAVLGPRTGHLAMMTLRGRGARTAAVITPIMLVTGLATALLYLQTSQQAAAGHAYAERLRADLVVSARTGGLPLGAAAQASRIPGVKAASPLVTGFGFFNVPRGAHPDNVNSIPLVGLDGTAARQVTSYPVTAGSLSRLTGDSIAIPANSVQPGRDLGDVLTLRFGDNRVRRLKIVAIITTRPGYPVLLLPARLLAAHTTTGLASQVLISTTPQANLAAVEHALRSVAPGAIVAARLASLAAFSAQQQTGAWVSYMFITALTAYATVSLISTTVAAPARRRPQLRMLRGRAVR